jgi:hypothetical protein
MACIVCNSVKAGRQQGTGDFARFHCDRCGAFVLSGSAEAVLPRKLDEAPLRRALMSHTLRRMQRPDNERSRVISSDDLPTFWAQGRLPSPQRQADELILWIGDNQPNQLDYADTSPPALAAHLGLPLYPTGDGTALGWLFSQLKSTEFYQEASRGDPNLHLRLTMAGWTRYEELKRANIQSRTAFMAMKFGDAVLNRVVVECFRPAVARTGFELRLLTDEQPAGLIDNQLRAAILASRFLLADLSHGNPGAYWKAGFADGLGLPVIYTCEKGVWSKSKSHFDTNHMYTVIWNVDDLDRAGRELTATIRATLRAEAKQTD